jgi:hypothetical protein
MNSAPERRAMRRFEMRLPATIRVSDGGTEEWLTETRNVSARGLFFITEKPWEPGTRLEVTLMFPPQVTFRESVRVRFTARVLRIEEGPANRVGIAACIEAYEFLRSLREQGLEMDEEDD